MKKAAAIAFFAIIIWLRYRENVIGRKNSMRVPVVVI